MSRNISADLIAQIAAQYEAGETLVVLERSFGIPQETIRRHLKANSVALRPRGKPEGKHRPNGGRTVDKSGYVLVLCPGHPYANFHGYVREHRLVIEQIIGRYLQPGEVVHHRNGIKDDNRPENLHLYDSQARHKQEELRGNQYSLGKGNRGKRVFRSREQMLQDLIPLLMTYGRYGVKRVHLEPPYPSYKALNREFGHWMEAVKAAFALLQDRQSDTIPDPSSPDALPSSETRDHPRVSPDRG